MIILLLLMMILVQVVVGLPHLRIRDNKNSSSINEREGSHLRRAGSRERIHSLAIGRPLNENVTLGFVDSSSNPLLLKGVFVVSTLPPDVYNRSHPYCETHPTECALDPSIVSYTLNHCVPDPLGLMTAVKVSAFNDGNVVVTSFTDIDCAVEVGYRRAVVIEDGGFVDGIKYEIRTDSALRSPVRFMKEYYFDETCDGPHSKVARGSYAGSVMRTGICWNDPYNGQSYIASYHPLYSGDDFDKQPMDTAEFKLCVYDAHVCGGCHSNSLPPDCEAAFVCYDTAPTAQTAVVDLPGLKRCVKEGSHYTFSYFGGDAYYSTAE
jgi:hypothetical protein